MRRSATPKLHAYLALVGALLVGAFALRRPELVVVAAPLALLIVFGVAGRAGVPDVQIGLVSSRERAIEGDRLSLRMTLRADRPIQLLDLSVSLPFGLEPSIRTLTLSELRGEEQRTLDLPVDVAHWGVYGAAKCALRARTTGEFYRDDGFAEVCFALRVYPRSETLRALIVPRETQPFTGNLVARGTGRGIEFAEIRLFQPGDELRHVNWRATARHGETWVNVQRPERNADVILFLDTYDIGSPGVGALNVSVRAAAALAARYLRDRERVGVIGFGGTLHWLIPGSGERQLYQIVESLITTQLTFSYAWKDVSFIPAGTLPPQALVIALTPLVDQRVVTALFDLLRRGFDLAVLELSLDAFLPEATDVTARLACRIWRLEQEQLLDRYRELGCAVARWSGDRPLEAAIEEVTQFRRHARIVSAS